MKKIWIACDIEGTFNELSTREKILFVESIEKYRKKEEADTLVFSFISTLECSSIKHYVREMQTVIETLDVEITLGPHFGIDGYFKYEEDENIDTKYHNISKGVQMATAITNKKTFFDSNDTITNLIYIDDMPNINPSLLLMRIGNQINMLEKAIFIIKDDTYNIRDGKYMFDVETIKSKDRLFMIESFDYLNKKRRIR